MLTGLVPFVAGSLWFLHEQRAEAVNRAYLDGDLLASGTAASVGWMLQDTRTVMTTIAARIDGRSMDGSDCDPIFREMKQVYPAYDNLVLRRPDGMVTCAPFASLPKHSILDLPWFRQALATKGFRVGDAFNAPLLGRWVAVLTYTLTDAAGNATGVLIMPLDLDVLRKRLYAHVRPSALVSVIDGQGRVLARSQRHDERVGRPVQGEIAAGVETLRVRRSQGDPAQVHTVSIRRVGTDGVNRLQTMRTVPHTDWTVIAGLPEDEALAKHYLERRWALGAILLIFLVATGIGVRLTRRVLVPMRSLSATAEKVAAGCGDSRAREDGPNEVVEVAQAFNRMLDAQRDASRALAESEARHRQVIESLPAGVISYDANGRVEFCNARAAAVLGLPADTLVGATADESSRPLVDVDGRPLARDRFPVQRVLATGEPVNEVVGYLQPSSGSAPGAREPIWVQVSAHPERDAGGRIRRVVLAFVDVTAQRAADALRTAKETAEAANRSKSSFLSRMSHDIRTPLVAVTGYAQLFQRDNRLPADVRERAALVEAGCRQTLSLLDESLDLARIEAGAVKLVLEPLGIVPVLAECVALCEPLARPRGIALTVVADPAGDATVIADRTHVRAIAMNLLSNAIKYNRLDGRVTVTVRRTSDADGTAFVDVDVADTGPGMTAEQRAHLFEPFNRLGEENRGTQGHGLGLVIARALAQAMAGDLRVTSAHGAGSCFSLRLRATGSFAEPITEHAGAPSSRQRDEGEANAARTVHA